MSVSAEQEDPREFGMDAAGRSPLASRLERSSHTAFIDNNTMYVWGGYQAVAGVDVVLPSDEIWLCDLDSGTWEQRKINGDSPLDLSYFCGSHLNGTLYVFGGCSPSGYTNKMFSVDLREMPYEWKRIQDTKGTTPSPQSKHSCWVHRDRLIYFGGYGCKTMGEVRDATMSFIVEEMSWITIGNALFRCWGWNNEVNIFDPSTATWSMPQTQGPGPTPRSCHASAVLGNKGYISGASEAEALDMFCLDLETWTWTHFDISESCAPLGRSMFTMTPISDHALFIYGGLGVNGNTLNDSWHFDTLKRKWTKMTHLHKDKPRVCHTACLGKDNDVLVFGGSSDMRILMDSMAVLRAPSQHHCSDMLIFQMQPYSLCRLCEDFMGQNPGRFGKQLKWLPSKLHCKINKRLEFFSVLAPVLTGTSQRCQILE